jgi:DNA helicase HerA-like ATPase
MQGLSIAKGLTLPTEAVTQTLAILGIRGSGKTNTAVVLSEELLKAKHQTVIIDPVDVWWGPK